MKINKLVLFNLMNWLLPCLFLTLHLSFLNAQSSSAIFKQIKKLNFLGTVLYFAAHPDDENTRVISYFSNHLLARTAYLSLTRGDGGQNLIGPELREGLGLIRTQELLAARKIDGGEQFFTMANDFGYSKSPEETFKFWDKEKVLSQVIDRIKEFKPDIIINRFNIGSSGRTHGHHTASAIISNLAFNQIIENSYDENWKPKRLFWNTSRYFFRNEENFKNNNRESLIKIDMGVHDPITGQSNSEIAALSRSQHKSQGFGSSPALGSRLEYLLQVKGKPLSGNNPFEGINTSWTRIKDGAAIDRIINEIINDFDFKNPIRSVPKLLKVKDLISKINNQHWKHIKLNEVKRIIINCLGLAIQVNADIPYGVKGESLSLNLIINNPSSEKVIIDKIILKNKTYEIGKELRKNQVFRKKIKYIINEPISTPYWLIGGGKDGMYDTKQKEFTGLPNTPNPYILNLSLIVEGVKLNFEKALSFRKNDPVKGEVVTPFQILPSAATSLKSPVELFNVNETKSVVVKVKNFGKLFNGKLSIKSPKSWVITPNDQQVNINGKGIEQDFTFMVTAPKNEEVVHLEPELYNNNEKIKLAIKEISYDHIPKIYMVQPASARAVALNLKTGVKRVAYINGAGDKVVESIESVGVDVEKFDAEAITLKKLKPFDAVIVGIRAFNVNESLSYKKNVLWAYTKQGGNLLIQYNTSRGLKTKSITPLNIQVSRDRVTDENAEVKLLDSSHPVLNSPNKISSNDFEGWVQERGLYFPNQWDKEFTPLIEMNDKGESPKKGALLVAKYGKGKLVYTGLSFFRQLPEGVPGAYRLFFNLIANN